MIEICVRGADRYVGKTVEFTIVEGDGRERKPRGELLDVTLLSSGFYELMIAGDEWNEPFVVEDTSNLWVDFDPIDAWPTPTLVQNPDWVNGWSNE